MMPTQEQIERAEIARRRVGLLTPLQFMGSPTKEWRLSEMGAALKAALPTPEEHERGIDAAFEAFDHFRGSHKARVRKAIAAYLAATGGADG